jgi:hypothetical protein
MDLSPPIRPITNDSGNMSGIDATRLMILD